MSPTLRCAVALGLIAVAALVVPLGLVALAALALLTAALLDARHVRRSPDVRRVLPPVLSRGVPVRATIEALVPEADHVRLRQVSPAALELSPNFEFLREWTPDDDVRHVNWTATQRLGRPMTNQYRLEQARELVFLLDTGRLMAAPLGNRSRLDAALDAVAAVALAADELGDHCGVVAFDSEVRVQLRPRRAGGRELVRALFDLQPRPLDSDYEQAFRRVAGGRRSLVLVLCDLFDDAAASALIDAVPVLSRRHAVLTATVTDPDLERILRTAPERSGDVYAAAAALDLLDARARAAALLRRSGARVVEAAPNAFAAACVRAYLAAKASLRL